MSTGKQEAIEKLNEEFLLSWKLCTEAFPYAEAFDHPQLACRWAGISFRFYNALCLRGEFPNGEQLTEVVRDVLAFMRSNETPGWLVVTLEDLKGDARNTFDLLIEQENLISMPATGMECDLLPFPTASRPELRYQRIQDNATLTDFIDLNCMAYGVPIEEGRSVIEDLNFWHEHAYGYVAYEGGRPVSTATGIVADDCIFLFLVATHPEQQHRGYADAVIRHALNAASAATGIKRTSLQATDAGRPVYARLGYREVCTYTLVWPSK